jgi:hypothetical protein
MFADTGIEYDLNRTWNLSTLAVAPEYRHAPFQGLITIALVQATTQLVQRSGVNTMIAALYLPVLRMLRWKLHLPFTKFVGIDERPYPYEHSPLSLLTWFHVQDWYDRLAKRDPALFDIMVNGKGFEPAIRTPDWDAAAERVRDITVLADLRRHLH